MAADITVYEDWGVATGTPAKGAARTLVTNLNLKTVSDPDAHYYLNDLRRPRPNYGDTLYTITHKRYISWKISGTYSKISNVRIILPAPDGVRVFYQMTNVYEQSAVGTDVFGGENGIFDGQMIPLGEPTSANTTLYCNISTTGPESATTHAVTYGPNQTLYTGYLVLQVMALPDNYEAADNYGTAIVRFEFDELE